MSFDLWVWRAPKYGVRSIDAALGRFLEQGDVNAFEASSDVSAFRRDLLARYPALEDFPDDLVDDDPSSIWAVTPDESDRTIGMMMRWSVPDEAIDFIVELADRHGLFLYDPQGPEVHPPSRDDLINVARRLFGRKQ